LKTVALFFAGIITFSIFPACSSTAVERRQQSLTDSQAGALERREARQSARDERFRASRQSVLY
jgi:hypothetical protein